ncbi:MAG: hypothetical protein RMK74_15845 [Myxococcales bacterium]|nr:hypothetical protein [Myxococcales bacterium]
MGAVKFCPFCREPYEELDRCPAHDLPLVPLGRLPKAVAPIADDDPLPWLDPRGGRLWLLGAAAALLVGFLLPLASWGEGRSATGLEVAGRRAANFWAVPCVGAAFVSLLLRRRTPRQMRSVRIGIGVLALLAATSLGVTLWRMHRGALPDGIVPGAGAWLVAVGCVLGILAALRYGVAPIRGRGPSSGSHEES